jgi:hypothetical protein
VNCGAAQERVTELVADRQREIAARIAELESFAEQLEQVRITLAAASPPSACRADLSCCVPATNERISLELRARPGDASH